MHVPNEEDVRLAWIDRRGFGWDLDNEFREWEEGNF